MKCFKEMDYNLIRLKEKDIVHRSTVRDGTKITCSPTEEEEDVSEER